MDIIRIPNLTKKIDSEELELKDLSNKVSLYSSNPEDEDKDNISNISADKSNISSTNTDTPYKIDTRISKGKEILIL